MGSITDVPVYCVACGWEGTVGECIPDVDMDGGLGCLECAEVIDTNNYYNQLLQLNYRLCIVWEEIKKELSPYFEIALDCVTNFIENIKRIQLTMVLCRLGFSYETSEWIARKCPKWILPKINEKYWRDDDGE